MVLFLKKKNNLEKLQKKPQKQLLKKHKNNLLVESNYLMHIFENEATMFKSIVAFFFNIN